MIIKNYTELSTSKTRKAALQIINAGIEAVLTKQSILKQVRVYDNTLVIQGNKWDLSKYDNIYVIGAGKASGDMAQAIEGILGKKITEGIVIDTQKKPLSKIKLFKGTHPLPSKKNIEATNKIIKLLQSATERDIVICLISGGGSVLMDSPRISLKKLISVNEKLLKSSATIDEINTIRKHISKIKGGQLAEIASPAKVISLIVSDVMGNELGVIASGPTIMDKTKVSDAEKIRKKYHLPELAFVETPKKSFPNVKNILLITNVIAAEAMRVKAEELGYNSKILTTKLKGEAREIGKKLAGKIKPGTVVIATGETTVKVFGKGKGGRNQELVLGASDYIKKGAVASCSSDGVDFISEAAGAIADEQTKHKAQKLKLNAKIFLEKNDSYNFLKHTNSIIKTGKTGTNVGDLILILGDKE